MLAGNAYNATFSSWDNGKGYPCAYVSNAGPQDDLAVMASIGGLAYIPRTAINIANAMPLLLVNGTNGTMSGNTTGLVARTGTAEFHALNIPYAAAVTIAAKPTVGCCNNALRANLDIALRLFNSSGGQIASANAVPASGGRPSYTSFSATLSTSVSPGVFFVSVGGTGWSNYYTNYASLGAYSVAVTLKPSPPKPSPSPSPSPRYASLHCSNDHSLACQFGQTTIQHAWHCSPALQPPRLAALKSNTDTV